MKADKLKELGFKLVDEYVFGDLGQWIGMDFKKGIMLIKIYYAKNKNKMITNTVYFYKLDLPNITFKELKQLDKILNK